jgi:hypothetical protein
MSQIDLPRRHHLDAIASERWTASDQNRWTPQLRYARAASLESALNGARVYGVDVPDERKKTEADPVGLRKQAYRERATPVFETFGPKNDREFEGLLAERKGLPA